MLRDLAPGDALVIGKLAHTIWEPEMRLVRDVVGTPILASEDIEVGDLINATAEAMFPTEENGYPELEGAEEQAEKAKAAIIVVRMDPNGMIPDSRQDWQVDGILCYSKICTHVGCPISLWEQQTHHLLCPCHQSTFDLANSGGSSSVRPPGHCRSCRSRPTPRGTWSPRATSPCRSGPSYFERDSSKDFKEGDR